MLIKRFEELEKFLKQLAQSKEFWCREVLNFLNMTPDQQGIYLKARESINSKSTDWK